MAENNNASNNNNAANNNEPKTEAEILKSLVDAIKLDAEQTDASDVEILEIDELAQAQLENVELKDKLLRAVAEGENIRRRAERDLQDNNKFAITAFARDLVGVFENLSRATSSISEEMRRENQQFANLAMGVEMTLKQMEQVFGKYKIQRIDPIGEMFNHQLHQAMSKIEDAANPEGTILQVMQAAYVIHDRLLQPALVAVATAPAKLNNTEPPMDIEHVDTTA